MFLSIKKGKVTEWLKVLVLKTIVFVNKIPWVQIPPFPKKLKIG
jgi:hypothetical protein